MSLTPALPWHEAEFISAIRSGSWCAVAVLTNGDSGAASPADE